MCSALGDHPYPAHRPGFILNSKVKPCTTGSMADPAQGLGRAGISSAVTVNGMLSLPERHDALEKVRMGDASILLIAPEQLRSVSVRSVLAQREVGLRCWTGRIAS